MADGVGRALAVTVIALALGTLAGLVALWPAGERARIVLGPVELAPRLDVGDKLRLTRIDVPPDVPDTEPYALGSVDRRMPLLWLAIAVAVGAVLLVAWRGLLAVAGLVLSLVLVTQFLLPALLAGSPALLVALVTAMAVTFVTVTLTSGVGAQTMAAVLGIAATLALAAALAALVAGIANLDGRTSEVASALTQARAGPSLEGVVIAGVILGALGALTDTAVTQASAVMALRRSNPALTGRRLYREAFVVGRDHLSATIHTLVLAYTGATLPLLLAIEASGMRSADAISGQDLAEPIAATLIGALALLACVPLSTALTVWLVDRLPASALPSAHAHVH